MQEGSIDSKELNSDPPTGHTHSIRSWLNKFEQTKLESYSVLFGIAGLSCIILGICISILILTADVCTNIIDCSIINVTHTHVKLCPSYRCRIFKDCIPYICTIIFVRYHQKNISYESKLNDINSSCSYEPTSCISRSRIQFEQLTFLRQFARNISQTNQCCLHSITQQPMISHHSLNSTQYSFSILSIIICFVFGSMLILLGILTQLHLNNYLQSSHQHEEDFLNTILNFHFSNATIRSSIGGRTTTTTTPGNYDLLTHTISQHNTPSTTKIYPNDNRLLFDIEEENKIFQKECLRSNYQEQLQNEILRQYQLGNEAIQIMLDKLEKNLSEEARLNLPQTPIERIKYLLQTIDHLETYFPIDSFSLDHQSSPPTHSNIHFLKK